MSESPEFDLLDEGKKAMRVLRAAGLAVLLLSVVMACGGRDAMVEVEGVVADEGAVRERFEAYVDAHNRHDIEAELALYADEVIFEVPQQTTLLKREDLRPRLEWEAVTESHLSMSGIEITGDTVTIKDFVETSKWLQLAGIDEIVYEPGTRIVFTDGLISEVMPSAPLQQSQDAVATVMDQLMDWVTENRPEELDGLLPGGQLPYDGDGARKLIELLTAWRQAQH